MRRSDRPPSRLRWTKANTSPPPSCEACEGAMSDLEAVPTRPAADGFASYYTEKLWAWIPEIYRDLDGETDNPGQGTLRALVELMAAQAAVMRRDVDRLVGRPADRTRRRLGGLLYRRPTRHPTGQRTEPARPAGGSGAHALLPPAQRHAGGAGSADSRHRRFRRRRCRSLPPARPHASPP